MYLRIKFDHNLVETLVGARKGLGRIRRCACVYCVHVVCGVVNIFVSDVATSFCVCE